MLTSVALGFALFQAFVAVAVRFYTLIYTGQVKGGYIADGILIALYLAVVAGLWPLFWGIAS